MQYTKGESGNPAGRPPGIRDKRVAMRELLAPHAEDLVAKAVDLAKAGDTTALRICIDRRIPPAKAKDDPIHLPELGGPLAEAGNAILQAIADGRLSPDEGATVMQTLAAQVRIVETADIEKRIAALEAAARRKP